jgi:outer membrane protein TolC
VNQAQVGLELVIPLGRNAGLDASLKETSASLEEQASRFDLMSLTSQLLASTASAYWQLVGANKILQAQLEAEQRAKDMLESVQTLAKVDVLPKVQIQDALAFLSTRVSARIGQEKSVIQAQQQLGLAMGLTRNELLERIKTTDELPPGTTAGSSYSASGRLSPLLEAALTRRGDYLAAQARVEKQSALVAASRNALKPQIDLSGSAAYTGVMQGTSVSNHLAPILSSSTGPNVSFSIKYQFPVQNRAAQGALTQNQSLLSQQQLRLEATGRQVYSDIINAASALDISVLQLREARTASTAAKAAVAGATERLRNGVGSVLDSLQAEDRYISALINEITVQVSYASAIANFRYATGTFLDPERSSQTVSARAFYSPDN